MDKTKESKGRPPMIRYEFLDGAVIYPSFEPDGNGDWKPSSDEVVAAIRKDQSARRQLTKSSGKT
jgi:hypothetical protein